MSDKILHAVEIKDGETTVQWDVTFLVKDGERTNTFCVAVKPEDLPTQTPQALKALVKAKALQIKNQWKDQPVLTQVDVPDLVGDVTL